MFGRKGWHLPASAANGDKQGLLSFIFGTSPVLVLRTLQSPTARLQRTGIHFPVSPMTASRTGIYASYVAQAAVAPPQQTVGVRFMNFSIVP